MAVNQAQANQILEFNFGNQAQVVVSSLYLGLSTTAPSPAGANVTEPFDVPGTNYVRFLIDNLSGGGNWDLAASLGTIKNANTFTFVESTTEWASSGAPISHIFLADDALLKNNNILYTAALSASRAIPANTTVYFNVGSLVISLT